VEPTETGAAGPAGVSAIDLPANWNTGSAAASVDAENSVRTRRRVIHGTRERMAEEIIMFRDSSGPEVEDTLNPRVCVLLGDCTIMTLNRGDSFGEHLQADDS
jgi:hypothetical protein